MLAPSPGCGVPCLCWSVASCGSAHLVVSHRYTRLTRDTHAAHALCICYNGHQWGTYRTGVGCKHPPHLDWRATGQVYSCASDSSSGPDRLYRARSPLRGASRRRVYVVLLQTPPSWSAGSRVGHRASARGCNAAARASLRAASKPGLPVRLPGRAICGRRLLRVWLS